MKEILIYQTITEEGFNELLNGSQDMPFLVVFTAAWSGEGTITDTIVEGLAERYAGQMGFFRVDIEESPNLSDRLGIRRLPTINFFQDSEIVDQLAGMVPRRFIEDKINMLL